MLTLQRLKVEWNDEWSMGGRTRIKMSNLNSNRNFKIFSCVPQNIYIRYLDDLNGGSVSVDI